MYKFIGEIHFRKCSMCQKISIFISKVYKVNFAKRKEKEMRDLTIIYNS